MNALPLHGRFVWYELMTADRSASRAFYAELFAWEWQDEDMGELGVYSMAHTGETYHAGMTSLPAPDVPTHWAAYVAVPDVDRACVQATELGGSVVLAGTDIPKVGRFAILKDPSGGVIYPFAGANPPQPETPEPAPAGYFCWNELLTTDVAACETFYTGIFGWSAKANEMPGLGPYWIFSRGEKMECGMMPLPEQAQQGGAPSHWLPYVAVTDLDATVKQAGELNAKVYCQPTDIPQMGRFAVLADPQGAVFAVFQSVR